MSTIKATTLSNLAGDKTIGIDRVAQGTAAAWVNFNGIGTVAIRSSYNVSSITDSGTGTYTVNFAVAMPDANYAAVATAEGTGGAAMRVATASQYATGSVVARTATLAQVQEDNLVISVTIFR